MPNPIPVTQSVMSKAAATSVVIASGAASTQAASTAAVAVKLDDAQREAMGWTWVEAQVVGPTGQPLVGERCQWFEGPAGVRLLGEGETDRDGVIKLWLPPAPVDLAQAQALRSFNEGEVPKSAKTLLEALYANSTVLVFPEILEGFEAPLPRSGSPVQVEVVGHKCDGVDDPRRFDYRYHIIPHKVARYRVTVARLTPEEKFQYLLWIYTGASKAKYTSGTRVRFESFGKITKRNHWLFPRSGVTCNTHVNFFLGYWFNYSGRLPGSGSKRENEFTSDATATEMACIAVLDSGTEPFKHSGSTYRHRGYNEFLEPVSGSQLAGHQAYKTKPTRASAGWEFFPYYIRMSQFFDYDGNPIKEKYDQLIAALGDFNVYSVADLTNSPPSEKTRKAKQTELMTSLRASVTAEVGADPAVAPNSRPAEIERRLAARFKAEYDKWLDETTYRSRNAVAADVKKWLVNHKTTAPFADYQVTLDKARVAVRNLTDAQIQAFTRKDDIIWKVLFHLDERDAEQAALLRQARDHLNWGHHCGVMLKRDAAGAPLRSNAGGRVWKFSADGGVGTSTTPWFRCYDRGLAVGAAGDFLHLAIWKCKDLSHGGFAPQEHPASARPKVSLNNPPRFVFPCDSTLS